MDVSNNTVSSSGAEYEVERIEDKRIYLGVVSIPIELFPEN